MCDTMCDTLQTSVDGYCIRPVILSHHILKKNILLKSVPNRPISVYLAQVIENVAAGHLCVTPVTGSGADIENVMKCDTIYI